MYTAGSKGKWIWKNMRGHVKGQPTGYTGQPGGKWGYSYGGPGGAAKPKILTIGGTTASRSPYDIGKRTPIAKTGGYYEWEKMARALKQFKRDPISMVQERGLDPIEYLPTMYKFIARMTGKPLTLDVPSVTKKLAKSPSFKSVAQIIQGQQELRARVKLAKLQPGNIYQGVV
jgi:hypothetical protein